MRDKFQVDVPLGRRYIGSGDENRAAALDRQDLLIGKIYLLNVERHEPKKDRELGKDLERDMNWVVQNENSPSVN